MDDFDREPTERATAPGPETQLAAQLKKWAATPPRQTNIGLITFTGLMMLCLFVVTWDRPDRADYLHEVAVIAIVLHGIFHLLTIRGLNRLSARDIEAARWAYQAYRDARRVNHVDLAIGWTAYALLVSILNWLSGGPAPGG